MLIRGEQALRAFRFEWTGKRMLDLIRQHEGRVRIDRQIGVGKSVNIDTTIASAIRTGSYDLVIGLFPTRRVLEERPWIQQPPSDVRIVNLRPRPRHLCGEARNAQWQIFEASGLGVLGRVEICSLCPHHDTCYWPGQYGKSLKGAQVIFATQAHLRRTPTFLLQLTNWVGAANPLVLFDEANFLMTSFRQRIPQKQLVTFVAVLKQLSPCIQTKAHRAWTYGADLLLSTSTDDLAHPDWLFPGVSQKWSMAVQKQGWTQYGESFRFLAWDLQQLGMSSLDSRERSANGDVLYAASPFVNSDFVIYSGTAHAEFSKFRLGQDFASPFADYRFEHPRTRWFNIASRLGTRTFFLKNAAQILDFFAGLVARRLKEGKRVLLVTKKCFVSFCEETLTDRLRVLGISGIKIVSSGWTDRSLSSPDTIPLIHYGMIGTNLFEQFDCAYCLTGFYVNEKVIDTILQDLLAADGHVPVKIETRGRPRRRTAGAARVADQVYDVHSLAQLALDQQEMDVVLQAVGRVRPYTKPREVITFQCAAHPQLEYTQEFNTIGEARKFFAIPGHRTRKTISRVERIRAARRAGDTQREAATKIGVSLRTVKRYWNTVRVP